MKKENTEGFLGTFPRSVRQNRKLFNLQAGPVIFEENPFSPKKAAQRHSNANLCDIFKIAPGQCAMAVKGSVAEKALTAANTPPTLNGSTIIKGEEAIQKYIEADSQAALQQSGLS